MTTPAMPPGESFAVAAAESPPLDAHADFAALPSGDARPESHAVTDAVPPAQKEFLGQMTHAPASRYLPASHADSGATQSSAFVAPDLPLVVYDDWHAVAPAVPPAATGVLAYAHCASGGSGSGSSGNGSIALTALNTGSSAVELALNVPSAPRWEYLFTAPSGDLGATAPVLNGAAAGLRMAEDGSLPAGFAPRFVAEGAVVLPAQSSAVLVLLAGGAAACR